MFSTFTHASSTKICILFTVFISSVLSNDIVNHRLEAAEGTFKSCYYCRENALGFCAKLEIKKLAENCEEGHISDECLNGKVKTSTQRLHQGKDKTAILCNNTHLSSCEQVERADRVPLLLCCSSCKKSEESRTARHSDSVRSSVGGSFVAMMGAVFSILLIF